MAILVSGGCSQFQIESIGGIWSWSVETNNITGQGQTFHVSDIATPYGPLTVVMIPVPGDVILAMADSLVQIQQQFAPLLSLVQPIALVYNMIITEGDPSQSVVTLTVQNVGSFGSFMTATATPSVGWLRVNPAYVDSLGKNQQGNFDLSLNPATLLASNSPVSGVVNLQDNRNPPTTIPITVNVTINPRPVISASPVTLHFTHTNGVPSGAQSVTIQNVGPASSSLEFALANIQNNSRWLIIAPTSGGPLLTGESSIITFGLNTSLIPINPGYYQDTIRIVSSNASNSPIDISVSLTKS